MTTPRALEGGAPVTVADIDSLDFAKGNGLLPAVIQHAGTGAVLMPRLRRVWSIPGP